jgi:hypothetical protein
MWNDEDNNPYGTNFDREEEGTSDGESCKSASTVISLCYMEIYALEISKVSQRPLASALHYSRPWLFCGGGTLHQS